MVLKAGFTVYLSLEEVLLACYTVAVPSAPGRMILSGGSDGLVAISSPTTGMTVRMISDHKGAPISCIDVAFTQVGTD